MRQLTQMLVPVVALLFSAPAAAQAVCNTGYGFVIKDLQHRDAFMAKLAEVGIQSGVGGGGEVCYPPEQRESVSRLLLGVEGSTIPRAQFAIGDAEVARRLAVALDGAGIDHALDIAGAETIFSVHPAQMETVHKFAAEISAAVQAEAAGR